MNKTNPQEFDLDIFCSFWFMKLHFATAGGDIEEKLAFNPQHSQFRSYLMSNDYPFEFKYKLNPRLDEILATKQQTSELSFQEFNREAYLFDFVNYAKRGLFSFDRTHVSDSSDMRFHLVAYPVFNERFSDFAKDILGTTEPFNHFDQVNSISNELVNQYLRNPIELRGLFFP